MRRGWKPLWDQSSLRDLGIIRGLPSAEVVG